MSSGGISGETPSSSVPETDTNQPIMPISWTAYEIYTRCPLWYYYAYKARKSSTYYQKDSQHLARGRIFQNLMDKWVTDKWYLKNEHEQFVLLRKELPLQLNEQLAIAKQEGDLGISYWDIQTLILDGLQKTLPKFNSFIKLYGVTQKDFGIKAQYTVEAKIHDHQIMAIVDFAYMDRADNLILIEGKATLKPSEAKDDQLRWQVAIFKEIYPSTSNNHFYLFYLTGEFWPIKTDDAKQVKWEEKRDYQLDILTDGNIEANPGAYNCRICPYQNICPEKYVPKKKTPKLEINPGKTRIVSMD